MANIGTLPIKSTKNLLSIDTRICGLVYAPAKTGKTKLAAGLDEITRKYRGKPTLVIACEVAEGGGTMTLNDLEIDYVTPQNWDEMEQLLAHLTTDEKYGGVVLDNASDYVLRIVKPHALKFPAKERALGPRQVGVPVRSDYQVMGEMARGQLNKLVNLTNESTPVKFRKDLIVTALEREKTDDNGTLQAITPAMPGALADVATALFQDVGCIRIRNKVVADPKAPQQTVRLNKRYLHVKNDGVRVTDSRTGIFQNDFELTDDQGRPVSLLNMYEQFLAGLQPKVN